MKRVITLFPLLLFLLVIGCEELTTSTTEVPTSNVTTTETTDYDTTSETVTTIPTIPSTTRGPTTTTTRSITTTEARMFQETSVNLHSYARGVSFSALNCNPSYSQRNRYFNLVFTKTEYTPVSRNITLDVEINDSQYGAAYYFAVLLDGMELVSYKQFIGSGPSFAKKLSFFLPDAGLDYSIQFLKFDFDNYRYVYSDIVLYASAAISWVDTNIDNRQHMSYATIEDLTPDQTTDITGSYVDYSFTLRDELSLIETLRVEIQDCFGDFVSQTVIEAESCRSEGDIAYFGTFDNLAPNANYMINLYAYGNDGVDQFANQFLSQKVAESAYYGYENMDLITLESYHGLYAIIYDVTLTSTEAIISYVYVNERKIIDPDSKEIFELHLETADRNKVTQGTHALEEGNNQLVVPIEEIGSGYTLKIYDQFHPISYFSHTFPEQKPLGSYALVEDRLYQIVLRTDYGNIVDIEVQLCVDGYRAIVESVHVTDVYNDPTFTFYHQWDDSVPVNFIMYVTYVSYGREYTEQLKTW